MYAAAPHGAARLTPGWTPTLGLPKGLKIKSHIKSRSQAKAKAKAKADQKIAAFGSSYMGLGVFSWILVGCQAAFASKSNRRTSAPTVGMGVFSWKLVGCQAAIASRLAPTEKQKPSARFSTTQHDER
jgi:hypothetical protein